MKDEVQQIEERTIRELSNHLTDAQLKEYTNVIEELRRNFHDRMQLADDAQDDEHFQGVPPEAVIWESYPWGWWRRWTRRR